MFLNWNQWNKGKNIQEREMNLRKTPSHLRHGIKHKNTAVILYYFIFLCKSKEDYEEEDVEEVVYKDSSHFLKVTIFWLKNNSLFDVVKNTMQWPWVGLEPGPRDLILTYLHVMPFIVCWLFSGNTKCQPS